MNKQITIRMPQKLLARWLKALRSGEYEQAKGTLYDPKTCGFCCLGVLQHVVSRGCVEVDDIVGDWETLPTRGWLNDNGIKFRARDMWTGRLKASNNPFLPTLDGDASTANDDDGRTFAEIADAIEACAEGV